MTNAQMELGFGTPRAPRSATGALRKGGAAWWFARMRQVVEHAFEWRPSPGGQPEQIWLTGLDRARSPGNY